MNTSLRPTRLASCLALAAVALVGCSESDLEALHDERLDDAVAARAASPEPARRPPRREAPVARSARS